MHSTQYARAVEHTPNGRRRYQASARPDPLFTRGNQGHWDSGITRAALNAQDEGIRPARRPWRELPDIKVKVISKPQVCPGCGIVPPRSAKCNQCWG